jgi:ribosome biogenesis GTPase A
MRIKERRRVLEVLSHERLKTVARLYALPYDDNMSKEMLAQLLAESDRLSDSNLIKSLTSIELESASAALGCLPWRWAKKMWKVGKHLLRILSQVLSPISSHQEARPPEVPFRSVQTADSCRTAEALQQLVNQAISQLERHDWQCSLERPVVSPEECTERDLLDHLMLYHDLYTDIQPFTEDADMSDALKRRLGEGLGHLDELKAKTLDLMQKRRALELGETRVRVAVIGNFSSGKSCFINSLLGREVCPVHVDPTTSAITTFRFGDSPRILQKNGTEEKEISQKEYAELVDQRSEKKAGHQEYTFHYFYPFEGFRDILLVDTPGFENTKNQKDTKITEEELERADVVFFLSDIERGGYGAREQKLIRSFREQSKDVRVYLILNKADLKPRKAGERIRQEAIEASRKVLDDPENQVFLYSAEWELAASMGGAIGSLLRNIEQRVQNAIGRGENFEFHVVAKRKADKATLMVDKERIAVLKSAPPRSPTTRENILNILGKIRKHKDDIAARDFEREARRYEGHRCERLATLKSDLAKGAESASENTGSELAERVQKLGRSRKKSVVEDALKALKNCIRVEELSRKESPFCFKNGYRLRNDSKDAGWGPARSHPLRKINTALRSIHKELAQQGGANSRDELTQRWDKSLTSSRNALAQHVTAAFEKAAGLSFRDDKVFESKEAAARALEAVLNELDDSHVFVEAIWGPIDAHLASLAQLAAGTGGQIQGRRKHVLGEAMKKIAEHLGESE